MVTSCKPRPSAANRLSRGTVYPLGFFQFDIGGGIFQASWSSAVNLRGGECMTGGGGEGGPRRDLLVFELRRFHGILLSLDDFEDTIVLLRVISHLIRGGVPHISWLFSRHAFHVLGLLRSHRT